MGYGLSVNVPVLVNRNPRFDLVINHYRAFNLETGPASGMDLMVHPAAQGRFGTFLDLIQGLDAANCDTVLVVNHGLSDRDSGRPLGLVLPLTARTPHWNPEEYTLGLLTKFIGRIPDEEECKKAEQDSIMDGAAMPAGTLRPLATALQNLRVKRRLKRLELRACNLGGNEDVMKSLGMVLGVQAIVAPKVHMFYLGVTVPLPVPFSDAGFATWLTGHAHARSFTDVAANPGRVAIQVNGTGPFRTMDIATTSLDVRWFVEKYICPGSGYISATPGRNARVAPFTFSGMDSDHSFALGQEDAYEDQLVEVAVPRVALTTTVERK